MEFGIRISRFDKLKFVDAMDILYEALGRIDRRLRVIEVNNPKILDTKN